MTTNWPERIWLRPAPDDSHETSFTVSEMIGILSPNSIEYVRADTVSKWQDISTAPKERVGPEIYQNHGQEILACDRHGYVNVVYWDWHKNGKTGNWKCSDGRVTSTPTHWMPLPPPPKDGE